MKQTGLFWHVYHDSLMDWCYRYAGRVEYIKTYKPASEREIRLRLFQPVRGTLPKEISRAVADGGLGLTKALEAHASKIEALHAQECPDCPWDGKTIFPRKKGKKR